ncbi:MAG: pyridoxamine 5'-phosphate oxidase family protein, partial [Bacteroidales bacterium]|nr:pyridoxamine 5'-phosphate oxidase family protein [Bacteroidales bacterium]
MKYFYSLIVFALLVPATGSRYVTLNGQTTVNRDTIILAAHEIIDETTYCGLVTIDLQGQPQVRTMNPFPVKDDFIVWFATSRNSRKVK